MGLGWRWDGVSGMGSCVCKAERMGCFLAHTVGEQHCREPVRDTALRCLRVPTPNRHSKPVTLAQVLCLHACLLACMLVSQELTRCHRPGVQAGH